MGLLLLVKKSLAPTCINELAVPLTQSSEYINGPLLTPPPLNKAYSRRNASRS